MVAKRDISHTLKNLKFMQRAAQKLEKTKKEEGVLPAGDFPSSGVVKRCVVVVEGDPHPGTIGRMSFLSFNPSIDKLNNGESDHNETGSATTNSSRQNEATTIRENGLAQYRPENMELDDSISVVYGDFKRKQAGVALEAQYPKKPRINDQDNHVSTPNNRCGSQKQHNHVLTPNNRCASQKQHKHVSTPNNRCGSQKQHKGEKLDWSVLRPPKYQSKSR